MPSALRSAFAVELPTVQIDSTTALRHPEAMKTVQSEWHYWHASILYFPHSERHLSACWKSHMTKLQHYGKNTDKKKNLNTALGSLSETFYSQRNKGEQHSEFFI